jgi:hypothetical protein
VSKDLTLHKVNTSEVCGVLHLGTPEAQDSEVNLSRPIKRTRGGRSSLHEFANSSLQRIVSIVH